MMARRFFSLFLIASACTLFPDITQAGESTTALRERILVLEQAQDKASEELAVKQRQGIAREQDFSHHKTVSQFLERQIDDACSQLADSGGSTSGLPCQNISKQVVQNTSQQVKKVHKISEPPPERKISEQKKTEIPVQADQVQQQPPQPDGKTVQKEYVPEKPAGFFATIAQWLKSLFMPKPLATNPSSQSSSSQQEDKKSSSKQESTQTSQKKSDVQQSKQAKDSGKKESSSSSRQAGQTGNKKVDRSTKEQAGAHSSSQKNQQPSSKISDGAQSADHEKNGKPIHSGNAKPATKNTKNTGNTRYSEKTKAPGGETKTGKQGASGKKPENGQTNSLAKTPHSGNAKNRKKSSVKQSSSAGHKTVQKKKTDTQGQKKAGTGPGKKKKENQIRAENGSKAGVKKLERSLNDALGEFDGTLLSAQERLAARIPSQREEGESGAYGAENGEGLYNGQDGNGEYAASGSLEADETGQLANTNNPGGVAASGGKIKSGNGRTTIDSDDDIVARQLREAAEKEKDPVLKEKLWQEYKKYKAGK